EVGAGTGGTSAAVLAALDNAGRGGARIEYLYTDISPAFVRHGLEHFGASYPFAAFRTLDITRDVVAQGFAAGTCDVVLAANALHAVPDLGAALAQARLLLRPGGVLVLYEMTAVHDFVTLTFGLLDGWWHFTDAPRRLPH